MTDNTTLEVITRPALNPAAVYLANLSKNSRRGMGDRLNTIAALLTGGQIVAGVIVKDTAAIVDYRFFDWSQIRYEHATAIRAMMLDSYAPSTSNMTLAALRGVMKTAWRLGQLTAEEYQRVKDIDRVRGSRLPAGRGLSIKELSALMEACSNDGVIGARDAAMIAVNAATGLRSAELTALLLEDYDQEAGTLLVKHGKGDKERVAYVVNGAEQALHYWLLARGDDPGALFMPVLKGGKPINKELTHHTYWAMLRRRAEEAGIKSFSPHDLRRTFVSNLLGEGVDLVTVSQMAGHSDTSTTARYDRRGDKEKVRAAGLLHIPYTRPGIK